MAGGKLSLSVLPHRYAVCRLGRDEDIPAFNRSEFWSVTRTDDETSVVCAEADVPETVKSDRGWRCLKVQGPLDFSLTGVLVSLARPLAEADISLFAISTYDTDYLLVKEVKLDRALAVLSESGHQIEDR